MKKNVTWYLVLGLLLLAASPSFAGKTSVGLKASTLGAGIEIEQNFNDTFGGRLGLNYFTYNYDGTEDDISYEIDLDLFTVAALVDWHPFSGSFRVSAGGIYNGNELSVLGQPTGNTYEIGDSTYDADDVGTLSGTIDFDDIAAYTGIGWNTAFDNEGAGWGFIADIGVLFQGVPQAKLSATGLAADPVFQNDLEKEQQNLQSDLDEFEMYPVVSVGVTYSF